MNDKPTPYRCSDLVWTAVFFFFIGFGVCAQLFHWVVFEDFRTKAIERGSAYWETNQKSGHSTFKWKGAP